MSVRRSQLRKWLSVVSLMCLVCLHQRFCFGEAEFEGFGDDIEEVIEGVSEHVSAVSPTPAGLPDPAFPRQQWDEDEFEIVLPPSVAEPVAGGVEAYVEDHQPVALNFPQQQMHHYWEVLLLAMLVGYAINLWFGRLANENLAIAWAKCFTTDSSILEKNFALIGPGDVNNGEVLMKESQSCFKFYASGRRYCECLFATLDMRQRQDALSLLSYFVSPKEDIISIEVNMGESIMPPVVLAVGTPKVMRNLIKEEADLSTYTKQIVPSDGLRLWPNDRLHASTELSSVFYDIFSDPRIEHVFSESPKYFRSLHFTSEAAASAHKKVLKFVFNLPPVERMGELTKLMQLVPLFIDIIGTYKMPAEVKKKALKARSVEEEKTYKSGARARQEALMHKKLQKLQMEKDRLAKMHPEARQKHEDKQQAKAVKRATKVKMLKS